MAENKDRRQTAIRLDRILLRKAKYYLDEDNKNLQTYLEGCLVAYVTKREERAKSILADLKTQRGHVASPPGAGG